MKYFSSHRMAAVTFLKAEFADFNVVTRGAETRGSRTQVACTPRLDKHCF